MNRKRSGLVGVAMTALLCALSLSSGLSAASGDDAAVKAAAAAPAPNKVDFGAFTKEIMVLDMDGAQSDLAMWLPASYFAVATRQQSSESQAAAEEDVAFLKPYVVMIVQSSMDRPDGTTVYAPESLVRSRAVLKAPDGTFVKPLVSTPPLVAATAAAMKAAISSDNDKSSKSMYILVFPAKTAAGAPLIDETKRAKLELDLRAVGAYKATTAIWRTPFDAVHPVAPCPSCGEPVSAKWSYCPYCGKKLDQ